MPCLCSLGDWTIDKRRVYSPETVIHRKYRMDQNEGIQYTKRSQKDYTHSFELQIVGLVERGELFTRQAQKQYGNQSRSTVMLWLRKYGNFDWENLTPSNIPKGPEQRIMELEAKLKSFCIRTF